MVVSPALIIYDDGCPMCRNLAVMVAARQPAAFKAEGYGAWLKNQQTAPSDIATDGSALLVQLPDQLLVDDEAWQYILAQYRDLRAINWLAAKIGIHRQTAKAIKGAGSTLRRFCRRCKKRV